MAAAGGPVLGATNPTLTHDDFCLYGYMSDDELMQLAIERSLTETQNNSTTSSAENTKTSVPQRRTEIPRPNQRQTPRPAPAPCPANPPRDKNDQQSVTVSHFITGNGKRMVAYRRYDGTLIQVKPEEEEEVDPVLKAIRDGDVGTLRGLIKKADCNLLMPNEYGWIPLHEAAHYGQEQCIKAILRVQPGMINKRTLKDQTALLLAVSRENKECVACLLEKGADPDIANKDKETPLYKACEKENPAIVAMLLNHGATVNKSCIQGWTALHEAVCRNNVEICEMLVKAGAKISTPNVYGITPIFVAAQSGNVDTLRFLLKNGADINSQAADGATALYEACKNGHVEIVEFLLSQKADANKPGKTGLLPIHIAAQRGNDRTDLFTYGSAHNTDRALQIVSMLIPATSKARVRRSGISPLHLAAERNRDEILELLIESGFDVNATLSEDRSTMYEDRRSTALYFSVINNNIEATSMLLQAGADPNLDTFSPLLVALRQGCIRTVTLLVEYGANINAYIPTHPTTFPATVMFCMKYLTVLKYLMDNGGDALSCFSCVYGSDPHPPLKTSHSDRTRYRDDQPISHNTCVQFCDIVSTDTYSPWAGPIIDVLLDYVGDVKLCSRLVEHLDSYADWASIKEKAMPPRPLMQLCRLKIRKLIGIHRLNKIKKLPLPGRLIKFLNHEERTQDL
ncbi:ankyrin repeat and SOCS box protein 2 isoform X1 [Pangasianodon hypophthalmus]|uniref:ankyrin repeat and SOCS box protein 2 isoform X1 n=1 Tax=Pangasianodon hypophthalmus TaxID=310915 RepID=UPI002308315E|nr:ankyrin repeat and SOCS box protein 2 isoform X1 [Pangasianodon hypophthalmus]XP_053098332.1 ankyrin repeat and SOCS box protein 2 isoform X1 [Pangasianodon hypophthalmus]